MWRLKWKCPFCGYGYRIGIVIFLLCVAASWVMHGAYGIYEGKGILVAGIALALLIPSYLWVNRLRPGEREKLAAAKPLQWKPLTKQQADRVKKNRLSDREQITSIVLSPLLIFCFLWISGRNFAWMASGILITFLLCLRVKWADRLWFNMDASAECAEIQPDHTYALKEAGRDHTVYRDYAVFYTPEGKLVMPYLEVDPRRASYSQRKFYIVRFHGLYEYLDFWC